MPTHLKRRNRFSQADKTSSNCSRLASDSSAPASPVTSLCWISYRSAWFIATGWGWTVSRYSSWIQAAPMKWLKVTLRIFTHKHTQKQKATSNLSCVKNEYRLYTKLTKANLWKSGKKKKSGIAAWIMVSHFFPFPNAIKSLFGGI